MVTLIHIPKGNGNLFIMATTSVHIYYLDTKSAIKSTASTQSYFLSAHYQHGSLLTIYFSRYISLSKQYHLQWPRRSSFLCLFGKCYFYKIRRRSRHRRSVSSSIVRFSYIFSKRQFKSLGVEDKNFENSKI